MLCGSCKSEWNPAHCPEFQSKCWWNKVGQSSTELQCIYILMEFLLNHNQILGYVSWHIYWNMYRIAKLLPTHTPNLYALSPVPKSNISLNDFPMSSSKLFFPATQCPHPNLQLWLLPTDFLYYCLEILWTVVKSWHLLMRPFKVFNCSPVDDVTLLLFMFPAAEPAFWTKISSGFETEWGNIKS